MVMRSRTVCAALAVLAMPMSISHASPPNSLRCSTVEVAVPGSLIQAIEGIEVGPDGMIYGTSIHGQAVYRIDPDTGHTTFAVPSPYGESDDVAIGQTGSPVEGWLAWTAYSSGEIRIQRPGGMPEVVATGLPRVNPIALRDDGRLLFAQSSRSGENGLWELDLAKGTPRRLVAKNKWRLNGFDFGPDGRLYAPSFRQNELLAIDIETGESEVVADDVGLIAALKVDADGNLWSVDFATGDLYFTQTETGQSRIVTQFTPPLDNLAIDPDGIIYVAELAIGGVTGFDPKTMEKWTVTSASFTVPLGMTTTMQDGKEAILIADPFGYRFLDPDTYAVTREADMWFKGRSSAIAANSEHIVTTDVDARVVTIIDRSTNKVVFTSEQLPAPRGIVLTSSGDTIIADAQSGQLMRPANGVFEEVAKGLNEPIALALESSASVLVSEIGSGTISRIDLANGNRIELVSDLADPLGIALLPDGRIAVAEAAKGTVTAINPVDGTRTILAKGLRLARPDHRIASNAPVGIAVDDAGAIFVSAGGQNSVVKIVLNGC